MTTATLPVASPAPAPSRPRTFEERLADAHRVMDKALPLAHAAMDVNTAHIPSGQTYNEVVVGLPVVDLPVAPAVPCPYTTPVAQALHRARARLEAGWCTGKLRDEAGAVCLLGAIRAEGGGTVASDLLWEVIRRAFPGAETVPSWNDAQRGPGLPLLMLDRAAALAHARGL